MLICPIALEYLQTLDTFLTERTLQDLASDDEAADSLLDSTRSSVLLQLFHIAQSFAQHRQCLAETISYPPHAPGFAIASVDSILVYAPSFEEERLHREGGNSGSIPPPTLMLNPCDFFRPTSLTSDADDDDDEDEEVSSASLLRWTRLILGDVLNSSFASVEEFMRSSQRHRRPRLDVRLCETIERLRAEILPFDLFMSRTTQLLHLVSQSLRMRRPPVWSGVEGEEEEERYRREFVRQCGVEEARVTGDLIRLLFQFMENDQFSGGGRTKLEFDAKMALASVAKNAQWLIQIRKENYCWDESVFRAFSHLIV